MGRGILFASVLYLIAQAGGSIQKGGAAGAASAGAASQDTSVGAGGPLSGLPADHFLSSAPTLAGSDAPRAPRQITIYN
jgi:hypothetical protein